MSTTSKYLVPASYEYHGHIEVEANSPEEAIEKAHSLTYGQIKKQSMLMVLAVSSLSPTI